MADLTIGIPTYQRRSTVLQTVVKMLPDLPQSVEVLVIDDCSTDGTYEALKEAVSLRDNVRVLRNTSNLKFVGNFGRLFEEAQSEYLLVCSDEDEVVTQNLPQLIEMCTSDRPGIVSPQAIIDRKILRGRPSNRVILPREWRSATNYISGTTYNVTMARQFLAPILGMASINATAEVYPQSLLAVDLLAHHGGRWLPLPLTIKREELQSHIVDSNLGTYWHLPSRWKQYVEIDAFLTARINSAESESKSLPYKGMLEIHRAQFYGTMREAIQHEHPDLAIALDRGALKHWFPSASQALRIIRHPRLSLLSIRDRLRKRKARL